MTEINVRDGQCHLHPYLRAEAYMKNAQQLRCGSGWLSLVRYDHEDQNNSRRDNHPLGQVKSIGIGAKSNVLSKRIQTQARISQ